MPDLKVREIEAKTILSKTGLPGVDWVVNPYTGCQFGCKYCYAYFVGKFTHPNEEWGRYVDVKVNAAKLFKRELGTKLIKAGGKNIGEIFFSSVTDPYQGLEVKYQLTRSCLGILAEMNYAGRVSVLTKSPLVTRDIDIFKQLKQVEVGLTVTSTGDPITAYLETYAPPHRERLKALKELHRAGITTYAFVGPLLPHLAKNEQALWDLLQQLKQVGVSYIYGEHLNLKPYIAERLLSYVLADHPELMADFENTKNPEYRQELSNIFMEMTDKLSLKVIGGSMIHHPDTGSWKKEV